MDFYKGSIPIFDPDDPAHAEFLDPKDQCKGYTPRDYDLHPEGMFAQPDQMQVIPQSEWDARYDEQEAQKSSLEHLFLGPDGNTPAFENLDQDGVGYCWAHSTAHSVMLDRLRRGMPTVRLSAFAVACKIKNFQDEGGWCGLSAKFVRDTGIPSTDFWPEKAMGRAFDNPKTWDNAATHKIEADWVDLTKQVYDQNESDLQSATALFNNLPSPHDFNWWSHSVCAVRQVRIEKGSWGKLILNSWKGWGRFGLGVLRGSKAVPNGALSTRLTTFSGS